MHSEKREQAAGVLALWAALLRDSPTMLRALYGCYTTTCVKAGDRSRAMPSENRVSGRSSYRRPSAWEAPRQSPDSYGIRRVFGPFHTISVGHAPFRIRSSEGQTRTETRTPCWPVAMV
jgi:hypothetical protein